MGSTENTKMLKILWWKNVEGNLNQYQTKKEDSWLMLFTSFRLELRGLNKSSTKREYISITTESFVYEYKGIKFSLVKIKDYRYNFEVEILTNEQNQQQAKEKILQKLNKLNLEPSEEKELDE